MLLPRRELWLVSCRDVPELRAPFPATTGKLGAHHTGSLTKGGGGPSELLWFIKWNYSLKPSELQTKLKIPTFNLHFVYSYLNSVSSLGALFQVHRWCNDLYGHCVSAVLLSGWTTSVSFPVFMPARQCYTYKIFEISFFRLTIVCSAGLFSTFSLSIFIVKILKFLLI